MPIMGFGNVMNYARPTMIFRPGNGSPNARNVVVVVRPPVGLRSNGRCYKILVMFLSFFNA